MNTPLFQTHKSCDVNVGVEPSFKTSLVYGLNKDSSKVPLLKLPLLKTEFLNAFKRLGLKTMQEAEGAKLFLDGCTVQVLITSLDESMTES